MIIRVIVTVVALTLGIYAFWGDALGQGHVLNPFGILFLLLAGLIWFGWDRFARGSSPPRTSRSCRLFDWAQRF